MNYWNISIGDVTPCFACEGEDGVINDVHHIENKKILLRLDLNVPILNGKITDTNRIDKILPTIKFLSSVENYFGNKFLSNISPL